MTDRPLGVVTEIVESAGIDVSYAYEDLVFLEHPGFLLQFTGSADEVLIHINRDMKEDTLAEMLSRLQQEAKEHSMVFKTGNIFRIRQAEEETVELEFLSSFEPN